ncbi:MAG: hypothetical protein P1V51_10840 [Deltaproteobacteria bacterium]|nr:hypothetical protein [Deltaproteobacteria bacterium]
MKRAPATLALLGITLMLAGACAHAPAAEEQVGAPARASVEPFFPLAVGNTWHYEGTLLGQKVSRSVSVVSEDAGWFVDSESERYQFDGDGLRSPARYLLKGPLVKGTRWNSVVSVSSTERYQIENVGVRQTTPAGNFEGCVVVLAENRQDASTLLFKRDVYCPEVGLVRFETWAEVQGRGRVPAASLQLVRYELPATATP